MAINVIYLKALHKLISVMHDEGVAFPVETACLSYPDIVVPQSDLVTILGGETVQGLGVRPDAEKVRRWHNLPNTFGEIFSTEALFAKMGIAPTFLDIAEFRGGERIVDLNHTLPVDLLGRFHLVIDTGTLEHCFNVGNAMASMCGLLAQGGWAISMAPLSIANHGFWNFSPTAYHDYLTQNGFQVGFMKGFLARNPEKGFFDIAPTARFVAPQESIVLCMAKRVVVQELRWPTQTKYLGMAPTKSANGPERG